MSTKLCIHFRIDPGHMPMLLSRLPRVTKPRLSVFSIPCAEQNPRRDVKCCQILTKAVEARVSDIEITNNVSRPLLSKRRIRTMSSAASRVLGLPELLEHVLLHLPILDLFVAQAVNRTFFATIHESLNIQRKMLLRHHNREVNSLDTVATVCPVFPQLKLDLRPYVRPFTYSRTYSMFNLSKPAVDIVQLRDGEVHISLELHEDVARSANPHDDYPSYQGRSGKHKHSSTWGNMKLAMVPLKAVLQMKIIVIVGRRPQAYAETVQFAAGKGTVGALVAVLVRVQERSHSEHLSHIVGLR